MRQVRRKRGGSRSLRTPVGRGQFDATSGVVLDYLAQLGTSRSLAVWLIFCHGDHSDLLRLSIDIDGEVFAKGYTSARNSYAATKLLLKSDFLDLGIDRKKVAMDAGLEAERLNRETNLRLRKIRSGLIKDPWFNGVLHTAARIVSRILGDLDKALHQIEDCGWTKGRSSSVNYSMKSPQQKYQASLECTAGAFGYGFALVSTSPLWSEAALAADGPCSVLPGALKVVQGNTAFTVPKNAKTDRLICYEPHINIRLQRSVGVYLARRLRSVGIHLDDQSPNQCLAFAGSKYGTFGTLDLSMASDTLCVELVKDLVPYEWYCFLDALRSKYTLWPHGWSLNEKFSSMGNGFTFELETIVFYALSVAASSTGFSLVYGDDIVCHTGDFDNVSTALSRAGFSVNPSKSFGTGRFRESCGEDYFDGLSFTAPRLEKRLRTVSDVVSFHNKVYSWLLRDSGVHLSWSRMLRRWRNTVGEILSSEGQRGVPLGPSGFGDGHFSVTFEEALPSRHPGGWDGYSFHSIIKVFRSGLVTPALDDEDWFENINGSLVLLRPGSLLSSALGPKAPLVLERSVLSTSFQEKRSPLFCHEWRNVAYLV